ncbi:ABC transporter ATP-binding protein [Psychromonas sp.]|uniref:ABC transporter ATP-binding protein n=1 Tax=Psychromonas sp. TaxID=1884585 RepID=UPI0039E362B0
MNELTMIELSMIELTNIHRDFLVGSQRVHALDDINLSIVAGEYISIMGPSGSGKSTLLNLIGLLDSATTGTYLLNQQNVTSLPDNQQAATRSKTIGFVFQAFHLIPRLTAAQNIELPLILAGTDPKLRHPLVNKAITEMDLTDRAQHTPDQLSGGQRQRVAIARATIMQPKLLLADEPTGNLDQKSGLDVINILEQLNRQGITVIIVTHDANIGERATRQIKMLDGRIESDQTLSQASI